MKHMEEGDAARVGFICEAERVGERSAVVTVAGELDLHTSRHLKLAVEDLRDKGMSDHLVVDLSRCTFIDSSGLGILVIAHKRSESPLNVVCAGSQACKTLEMTGLDRVFALHPTREEALAALTKQA
jgi:anti-sigma B factor antagonist